MRIALALLAASAPLACSSDPADPASGSSGAGTGSSDDTGPGAPDTGDPEPTTAPRPTTSGASGSDSLGTTTDATDLTTTDATTTTGDDTTTGPSPWDGEPLPPNPPGEWLWVDVEGSLCRKGSPTGIGVRYADSDKLAIFFEGGGACFNVETCLLNDVFADFGSFKFDAWKLGIGQGGVFNKDSADNPLADWNFIYVPYCTGDVHAGDKENGGVDGVFGSQQFVGYRNVALYLERLVPTFADASHILVTGQSAGGFGAAFNYDRIADAWPTAQVTLLDDSGPPFSDAYLAPCMQDLWRSLWNLDATIPLDCDDCFGPNGGGISNLAPYLAAKHPGQRFGLYSALRDSVIRTFFGFGMNDCKGGVMSGEVFEAGLTDLRDNTLGDDPAWATFYAPGINHTITAGPGFYTTEVGDTRLVDWLAQLLAGQTSHVAP